MRVDRGGAGVIAIMRKFLKMATLIAKRMALFTYIAFSKHLTGPNAKATSG
jgi:hypothetical protein